MTNGNKKSLDQLWGRGAIRAFISHKAEDKVLATEIKAELAIYGIASFVAHEDIEPLKEWEIEIERALFSMDILIALLTEQFSDSNWTDQEIGVAIGREKPIIPVRIGKDPYGLIGRYQAILPSVKNGKLISQGITEFLFKYQGDDTNLRELGKDAYIAAVGQAGSFSQANYLANFLPGFDILSSTQENSLVKAFNDNPQVNHAFDFRGIAAKELNRMTGNTYKLMWDESNKSTCWLEQVTAASSGNQSL